MDFSQRKLPREAASTLRSCAIHSVQPYAPMLAPVYVLMTKNEKFVSVKAPLDFFEPEELTRLHSFETFYFPEFVDSVLPFQQTARSVKALLDWVPKEELALPPSPYELADAVLQLVGPLWSGGQGLSVEPFFTAVFGNELCEPLSQELLLRAREKSVELYERGILLAGWAVFLALHLGYTHRALLTNFRRKIFNHVMDSAVPRELHGALPELTEIECVAGLLLERAGGRKIEAAFLEQLDCRVARKLASRIERVNRELVKPGAHAASIFGERGFVDV